WFLPKPRRDLRRAQRLRCAPGLRQLAIPVLNNFPVPTEPKDEITKREKPPMRTARIFSIGVVILPLVVLLARSASGQEEPPEIKAFAIPKAGYSEIVFHGTAGPFQIQTRMNLEPTTPWIDMPDALVTELGPGVFRGQFPNGKDDLAFYRVVSQSEGASDLKG